jgi:hypothetical protein
MPWLSEVPKKCQICGGPLKEAFVDGATVFGPWAIMCIACHRGHGRGLGLGRGQKFDVATKEKIDG